MKNELLETRRYLAAYLPLLPAERLKRQSGKPPEPPYALIEKSKGALILAACDAGALSLGLVPGLPLADARARVPELSVFPYDPDADRALLDWLVTACERYTPLCAVHPPSNILLDITGAAHFYEDEQAVAADLRSRLQRQGLSSRIALGATPDSARALARFACKKVHDLPVEALELDPKILTALRRAGLPTIGHLATRPRTPLATRFGKACTLKLARLLEEEDPHITPRRSPPDIVIERRFAEPLAHSETALMILAEMMAEAAILLSERGQGGRRFEARLFRSDGHVASLAIDSGLPTRDATLLGRLFRERIDSLSDPLDPGFGYDMIRLDVPRTEPLVPAQVEIDGPPNHEGHWRALLDQLSIRLGSERVRFFHVRESHIPERAFFTKATTAKLPDQAWPAPDPEDPPMRPLSLFDPPQPIEVTAGFPDGEPRSFRWRRQVHRVNLVEGPERIAPEWWRHVRGYEPGNARLNRDYYRVEDKDGSRFWLFRHGSDHAVERPKWYLHGVFA
jgi:protein ImuB